MKNVFCILFLLSSSLTISKAGTILKRSPDLETKGQNSPITWFILQQVNALGARLEKLRDKAEKSKENNQALQKDVEDLKKKQGGSESTAESLTEMRKNIKQLGKKVSRIDELKQQIKKFATQSEAHGNNTMAYQNNTKHLRTDVNLIKSKTKAIESTGNNNRGEIGKLRSKLNRLKQRMDARKKIVDGQITSLQKKVNTAIDKGMLSIIDISKHLCKIRNILQNIYTIYFITKSHLLRLFKRIFIQCCAFSVKKLSMKIRQRANSKQKIVNSQIYEKN